MKDKWKKCLVFGMMIALVGSGIFPTMGKIVSDNKVCQGDEEDPQIANAALAPFTEINDRDTFSRNRSILDDKVREEFFERVITKIMEIGHMSALSGAIIEDNRIIWAKGFGLYDREKDKLATKEMIYLVASISKTITATALM